MKSIKKISVFILMSSFFVLVSCEKEKCYSCDDDIDAWAKENVVKLSAMPITEMVKLSLDKQKAAYRTFKPERRKNIWIDKINGIISTAKSNDEQVHLIKVLMMINKLDFNKELTLKQEAYFFEWFDEGKVKFGWTDYFRISGFMMFDKAVNDEEEFKRRYSSDYLSHNKEIIKADNDITLARLMTINVANAQSECDSRWCLDCDFVGGYCDKGCEETEYGCGWIGLQSCDKNCTPF
ncbi:bacteriocin fulvocin C-related protein [Maribacter polysaccharolyticus]|uniref:bacteriocin fulvocin C-related protein n=1 Tax=Maribacter polysaccharolyticus TaxID=3020831 RepID=UPI00237F6EBC|nr:bacteriocin fulvocin C-related protein [Maribacter polysaccharolyticus]MDE3744086.1 bacteriocin fulvocin C-related protein [Maribacter polysaccharolyticus]